MSGGATRLATRARTRTTYRTVWCSIWGLILVAAVLWAPVVLPAGVAVTYFVLFGVLGALVTLLLRRDDPAGATSPRRLMSDTIRAAVLSGLVTVGIASVVSTLQSTGAELIVLAGLTAVPVRRWQHRTDRAPAPDPRRRPARARKSALRHVDDLELRRTWMHTFWALREATCVEERAEIAETRRACLEEIERRYPDEVARWLDAAPKASSWPRPADSDSGDSGGADGG
jgi:hypothetical protein